MSINFDRNRAQVKFEHFVGIASSEELLSKKSDFKNHCLTSGEVQQLQVEVRQDAIDFFYNGILSFAEGIDSIFQKRFSWATVKLYYSIYYLIRASLAVNDFAMLRCGSMFRLKIAVGQKPFNTGNRRYNTTHEGTISHYKDIFSYSDLLLANKIDDVDVYEWMMNVREIVNYRSNAFLEPDCLNVWDFFSSCVDDHSLVDELKKLEDDNYIRCFQEEFAVVAIPIKRIQQTISEMANAGILHQLTQDRQLFVRSVMDYDRRSLPILSDIFGHT